MTQTSPTPPTSNQELAARLRLLVQLSGLSQRELSRRALQGETHLGLLVERLERSETADVQRRTLESIANSCGVSLDWLVRGLGDPPTDNAILAALSTTDEVQP